MKIEISKRDNTIAKLEEQVKILDEVKQQRDQMQQQVQDEYAQRKQLSQTIEVLKAQTEQHRLSDEEFNKQLQNELEQAQFEKLELEGQAADKDVKIKTLMSTNLELQSDLEQMNEILQTKEDLEQQLQESIGLVGSLQSSKDQFSKELDNAGDYLLEVEEKCNKANRTAHELLS